MNDIDGVAIQGGLLYRDGNRIPVAETQRLARANGFNYPWQLSKFIYERDLIKKIRSRIAGDVHRVNLLELVFANRLEATKKILSKADWGEWLYSDHYDKDTNPDLLFITFTKK